MSTMSDRELLILAAKAAGIELWPGDPWCSFTPEFEGVATKDGKVLWRPQQDDGDSFRLMAKLKLSINHYGLTVRIGSTRRTPSLYEPALIDRPAALRRAILRQAAEMAKLMP